MKINRTFILILIWAGIVEGISTLGLFFVAMPMKYMYDQPMAVTIAGMVHGFLFLGLVTLFLVGKSQVPLSTKMVAGGRFQHECSGVELLVLSCHLDRLW